MVDSASMAPLPPVETPREPVTTTYHGVDVTEDYRWLEDGSADRTRAWTAAQDARTRAYLHALPVREPIRRRAESILAVESTAYAELHGAGPAYVALTVQPPRQQPFLVVLSDLEDLTEERVLLDPNLLDADGTTTIDWFVPSPDGSLVAVSLSPTPRSGRSCCLGAASSAAYICTHGALPTEADMHWGACSRRPGPLQFQATVYLACECAVIKIGQVVCADGR